VPHRSPYTVADLAALEQLDASLLAIMQNDFGRGLTRIQIHTRISGIFGGWANSVRAPAESQIVSNGIRSSHKTRMIYGPPHLARISTNLLDLSSTHKHRERQNVSNRRAGERRPVANHVYGPADQGLR
jgi:hypothetical protein